MTLADAVAAVESFDGLTRVTAEQAMAHRRRPPPSPLAVARRQEREAKAAELERRWLVEESERAERKKKFGDWWLNPFAGIKDLPAFAEVRENSAAVR